MTADLLALLDQLDEARAKATPGEWVQHPADGDYVIGDISDGGESYVDVADAIGGSDSADAACIVAEHNALPKLTAALRAVERAMETAPVMRFDNDYPVKAVPVAELLSAITAALTPESVPT